MISLSTENTTTGNTVSSGNGNLNSCSSGDTVVSNNPDTPMAMGDGGRSNDIDEDLYSRQLAVYGRETMRRLFGANVLISGMNGLGAEIAANAVAVSTLTEKLSKEQLSNYQAVVFADIGFEAAIEFDEFCHNHKPAISFIKTEVWSLFGSVFCDFGPEFTVVVVDGEEPHTGIIASISNDSPALVSCVDDERLEFQDGDLVIFSEVHGMTELNDGKPRKVKNARPYSFELDVDTTNYGVKQPKVLKFRTLKEALSDPGDYLLSDFLTFQALDKFIGELGRFPAAGSEEDAQKLISEIDEKLLRHFSFGSKAVLNPMAAMFGGIVGQEFFYFDSVESLPAEPLDPNNLKPVNSQYDAQMSVFGSKLQKKLEESKVFMVGSGALGCEFLKNFALMGVSCNNQGKDVIEKSNLSRQFLFRDWNIGQAKSTVAASAASSINPHLHIEVSKCATAVNNVIVPDFQPKEGVNIVTDEKATNLSSASIDDASVINDLTRKVEDCSSKLPSGFRMNPVQFEKDDDTNYHMDLIAGFANMLRITGTFANLALPLFQWQSLPPKVFKHRDMAWTVWDRWVLSDNPTLRELMQWLKDMGLNAYSISCGTSLLFNSLFPISPYRRHVDLRE
ncbi:hypothetical protein MKW94_003588 [Papaver nudicaule]|uniref:Ubiquitin-activating enzyme E1 C-terminal domain-containing protein n=1 Tax=Papaver nudicaule TaxID=74823 RepID=A0AA41VUL3_PAPNU|nr:hypothetical protein [Papaver nudicaule]